MPSFSGTASAVFVRKSLKRLADIRTSRDTSLKRGVNEIQQCLDPVATALGSDAVRLESSHGTSKDSR
jgi:hypothetical protein